jgi:hypothetical protein
VRSISKEAKKPLLRNTKSHIEEVASAFFSLITGAACSGMFGNVKCEK